MTNPFQETLPVAILRFCLSAQSERLEHYRAAYEANRHRVYSFAFWMTDSELLAEEISERTFLRAFSLDDQPTDEMIDKALLRELKNGKFITLAPVRVRCSTVNEVSNVRRNTKRADLERAIVQLPHTERMIFCMHDGDGYDHNRIARTLSISEDESRQGLHQARLRIRELVKTNAMTAVA